VVDGDGDPTAVVGIAQEDTSKTIQTGGLVERTQEQAIAMDIYSGNLLPAKLACETKVGC
jgi:hypothetical protein